MDSSGIKRVAQSKFAFWGKQRHIFVCDPPSKVQAAINKALSTKGVKEVFSGIQYGEFIITFEGGKHVLTCFDGPDWTVTLAAEEGTCSLSMSTVGPSGVPQMVTLVAGADGNIFVNQVTSSAAAP